jgi:PLP dependent protein
MNTSSDQIRKNLETINQEVLKAANSSGRNFKDIKVVVVTKLQPLETVKAAWEAGARIFGENYPEEALEKILSMEGMPDIQWHMIGHLQSRKARIVVEKFQMMHSLDSIHLAEKLNTISVEQKKVLPVMVEFNMSGEESKGGWPAWEEEKWDLLIPEMLKLKTFSNIKMIGLMTMPPLDEDRQKTRPYFQKLKKLQGYFEKNIPEINLRELSMGTSEDFRVAIEEGATYVRIGQAIVGPRPPKKAG